MLKDVPCESGWVYTHLLGLLLKAGRIAVALYTIRGRLLLSLRLLGLFVENQAKQAK